MPRVLLVLQVHVHGEHHASCDLDAVAKVVLEADVHQVFLIVQRVEILLVIDQLAENLPAFHQHLRLRELPLVEHAKHLLPHGVLHIAAGHAEERCRCHLCHHELAQRLRRDTLHVLGLAHHLVCCLESVRLDLRADQFVRRLDRMLERLECIVHALQLTAGEVVDAAIADVLSKLLNHATNSLVIDQRIVIIFRQRFISHLQLSKRCLCLDRPAGGSVDRVQDLRRGLDQLTGHIAFLHRPDKHVRKFLVQFLDFAAQCRI